MEIRRKFAKVGIACLHAVRFWHSSRKSWSKKLYDRGVIISVLSDGTSPDGIMSASLTTTLVSKLL
jgi:hypothetical protein